MTGRPLSALLDEAADRIEPAGESVIDGALGIARRRIRRKRLAMPLAAGALAILAIAAVSVTDPRPDPMQAATGGAPQLPRHLEDHSYLTANAQDAPPGRVVAALIHWVDLEEQPRLVLVGADRNSYRTLPVADGGSPGLDSTLVSRDGTLLASDVNEGLAVTDLRTGKTRHLDIGGHCCSSRLLGFAPDGAAIIVRIPPSPTPPPVDVAVQGEENLMPHLVDVRTGAVTQLDSRPVKKAAFSPDGKTVAVSGGGTLRLLDRAGRLLGERTITGDVAGPNAWTPDGRYIATVPEPNDTSVPATLRFVPADPADAANAPKPLKVADFGLLLGWRSERTLVVGQWRRHGGDLTEVDLRDGQPRVLASAPVTFDAVAAGLLADLVIVEDAAPDFGPWPSWARTLAMVALTLIGAVVAVVVWRVVRMRRRVRPIKG